MGKANKIVVEVLLPLPVEEVWRRSQEPESHVRWDLRFDVIRNLPERDARGFHLLDYRTSIAFGISIVGTGRFLHSTPLQSSTFEFDSADWKSLIRDGRGVWMYERREGGTFFKTVYDYDTRHGFLGALFDRLVFRDLSRLATEWSFETLRLWCGGDEASVAPRRSRLRFARFFLGRLFGTRPAEGEATSSLGTGK